MKTPIGNLQAKVGVCIECGKKYTWGANNTTGYCPACRELKSEIEAEEILSDRNQRPINDKKYQVTLISIHDFISDPSVIDVLVHDGFVLKCVNDTFMFLHKYKRY